MRSWLPIPLIALSISFNVVAQQNSNSFKSDLGAFFAKDEVDSLAQFAEELDTFLLKITAHSDKASAYKSMINLLSMHGDYLDLIALETTEYIINQSSLIKSLIWTNGVCIAPVGKPPDVNYHLLHDLEIPYMSRFGMYLAKYLKSRDFTFYKDYLRRWSAIGEPINCTFSLLYANQNEFDFTRDDDRFFISIYFLTFFYNSRSNSELLLEYRTQNIEHIMAEVNARRQERGLMPRDFEADRRRLQNRVAVRYRLKH